MEEKTSSPGCTTYLVIYVVVVTAMYFASTPTTTKNFDERQERDFHVAAVNLAKSANYVSFFLALLKAGKKDLSSVSFLLPLGDIKMDVSGHDLHKVTVLERHPDWQLVEYHFGNSHSSTSRYRAFKDRIEPVSYRMTAHIGIFFNAIVALIPAAIVSALINAIWNAVGRRRKTPNVA